MLGGYDIRRNEGNHILNASWSDRLDWLDRLVLPEKQVCWSVL